jgi:hypothetical protein
LDDTDGIAFKQFYSDADTGEMTHFPMLVMLFCDDGTIVTPLGDLEPTGHAFSEEATDDAAADARLIMAALAIINTPRIIGRREHSPHAGLQRDIARLQGKTGKLPMEQWTEILLEVTPPPVSGESQEARLTGHKALHFCRSFLRIRRGKLERVTGHWRGDPEIGIRRGRYSVVPPRQREMA